MKEFYLKVCKLEIILAVTFLLVTVFVLFIAALMRAFGTPLNWGMDIALLSFAWCVFLGADIAFREGEFVNVDILLNKMPQTLQKVVDLVIFVVTLVFLCGLIYFGTTLSFSTWDRSFQGIPVLSYTWVTLSIPISSLLMLITLFIKTHEKHVSRTVRIGEESSHKFQL